MMHMIGSMFLAAAAQGPATQVSRPAPGLDAARISAPSLAPRETVLLKLPTLPLENTTDLLISGPDRALWRTEPRPRPDAWPRSSMATPGPKVVYRHYHRAASEQTCPSSADIRYDLSAMVRRGFAFELVETLHTYVPLSSFEGFDPAPKYYMGRYGSQFTVSNKNMLMIDFPIAQKQVRQQSMASGRLVRALYECRGGFAVDLWVRGPAGVDPLTGKRADAAPDHNHMAIDRPTPRVEPVRPSGPGPAIRTRPKR